MCFNKIAWIPSTYKGVLSLFMFHVFHLDFRNKIFVILKSLNDSGSPIFVIDIFAA